MTLTASTLRHLLVCERRIWLDRHGDDTLRETVILPYAADGDAHETLVSAAMFGPTTPVEAATWSEAVAATQRLMADGTGAIRGGALERTLETGEPLTVRGRIDWMRRTTGSSDLGRWSYEPVEIKMRREPDPADSLQLDLYLWLLEGVQGVETSGHLWLGRDEGGFPLNQIEHRLNRDRLMTMLARAAGIQRASEVPPIFLASHCQTCPWHNACQEEAAAAWDVALLPGLSRLTWEQMRAAGLTTLDRVNALSPAELSQFKGVGKTRAKEFAAHARAVVEGLPVRLEPLPEIARQPGVMLDLETGMESANAGSVWCFGWMGADGQTEIAVVDRYFAGNQLALPDGTHAHIIPDSDEGWRLVARAAEELPGPVYHWGSFEQGVLRRTAPQDVLAALDGRLHDLNRTFRRTVALPKRGTSIKKVAPYLGFAWPEGTSAHTAWADYQSWLVDSDRDRLARACAYNRADVDALALIWLWLQREEGSG